jgi:hypothetical protein
MNVIMHITGQQIVTAVSMLRDQQQQEPEARVYVVPQELPR